MRPIFILFVLLFCVESSLAQRSGKRGLAFGGHSKNDLEVLAPGVSWWYNWAIWPESQVENSYQSLELDFMPMSWNGQLDTTRLISYLQTHPQIKYLLGFNEPNFKDQARMTPSEAAAKWPMLEKIADRFGLKLVSPAVNYCGNCVEENGTVYTDPVRYLDDFFAKCVNCRVDYIAVHWYGCGGLDWYLDLFRKYDKPIWVTEIACWDNENISLSQQKQYLTDVVWLMENDPGVGRYAWFTGRSGGPNIDILDTNGKLSELGKLYVNMPSMDSTHVYDLPARIEAEQFQSYKGCFPKETTDETGFVHMSSIGPGDFLSYQIQVPETKMYHFDLRYFTSSSASFSLKLDGNPVIEGEFLTDSHWNTYRDSLMLHKGKHEIRLVGVKGAWSANWLAFQYESSLILGAMPSFERLTVYPNPVKDMLYLKLESQCENVQIVLANLAGQIIEKRNMSGENTLDFTQLNSGIYLLKVQTDSGSQTFRIMKE